MQNMPRTTKKTSESELSAAAEPKRRRTAAAPSAAASHKHTKSKKATEVADTPAPRTVTQEDIAALAYSYWEARGYHGGSPEEDWLRAERELLVLAQDR